MGLKDTMKTTTFYKLDRAWIWTEFYVDHVLWNKEIISKTQKYEDEYELLKWSSTLFNWYEDISLIYSTWVQVIYRWEAIDCRTRPNGVAHDIVIRFDLFNYWGKTLNKENGKNNITFKITVKDMLTVTAT